MYQQRTPQSDGKFLGDVLKIALGVFIGALLAALTYEQLVAWRAQQALQAVSRSLDQQTQQERQALTDQARAQQRRTLEKEWERQQAEMAQAQALAEHKARAARKEQAWQRFFRPSATCQSDPSRGDCADAHIRAKKAFEAQYRDN